MNSRYYQGISTHLKEERIRESRRFTLVRTIHVTMVGYYQGTQPTCERISDIKSQVVKTGIFQSNAFLCLVPQNVSNLVTHSPRHLANFTFTPTTSSPLPLKVMITPTSTPSNPAFTFTIYPFPTLLSLPFPFSSSWASYLGFDSTLLQPPLPQGRGEFKDVEVGTENWKACSPVLSSRSARVCWVDLRQEGVSGAGENWWPGLWRWKVGLWLEDAVLTLGEPKEVKDKGI